jgi:hypothetical protein
LLTHEIVRYTKERKGDNPRFVNGSIEHRQYIFQRNLSTVNRDKRFRRGRSFFINERNEKGVIIDIINDFDTVEWDGLKVKFIELWFPTAGTTFLYHQSDLAR